MSTAIPNPIQIYHIVHVDRLRSIVDLGGLFSDAQVRANSIPGTSIGMGKIKERRLRKELRSHKGLHVGECVPFYFCPRSVMLYVINRQDNAELEYKGGQASIVHLVADFNETVAWARANGLRWAFTRTNAGAYIAEDFADIKDLGMIDWDAVSKNYWGECREQKQAEFLLEERFPWELVRTIGVYSSDIADMAGKVLDGAAHKPRVIVKREWYY